MYAHFQTAAEQLGEQLTAWRRHLHEFPELSHQEYETSRYIAQELERMGFHNVKIGFGELKTGVVADLNPDRPGACIALRADIDALPIHENSGLSFASRNVGVMHACGHDAHTAMLLGAARLLKEAGNDLPGKVRLIFQPGEEAGRPAGGQGPSAAGAMVQAGVLHGVDAVFGLHVWAHHPAGVVSYAVGPTMYAAGRFALTVHGQGGHGALPQNAVDPITTACEVVGAWQTIISREIDAMESGLISTGSIHGGTAGNIIPGSVELKGTIRSLSADVLDFICQRMGEVAEHICRAHRCRAEFTTVRGSNPVFNDPAFTAMAAAVAREMLGSGRCQEIRPVAGSDDYACYSEQRPAAYFFLGMNEAEQRFHHPHHNPKFAANDSVLPAGAALLAGVAWTFLKNGRLLH